MPDWTAPFQIPKLTDDEYRAAKAKYVAEHGYEVTMPGLEDIIVFGAPEPMSPSEENRWKHKEWDTFAPARLEELKKIKEKKRERYNDMLASPVPDLVQNAGSILTAIDNAQDAISTIACIGRVAMHLAPRALGRLFAGPVGWLLTVSDVLNVMMELGSLFTLPMVSKRTLGSVARAHPLSKTAKLRRARKLQKRFPGFTDLVQGLQTTAEVFGVGISLGPVVGFVQGLIWGGIRELQGKPIKWNIPLPELTIPETAGLEAMNSATYALAHPHNTDDMMIMELLLANHYSHQIAMPLQREWNALDQVENLEYAEVQTPQPKNILTIEVIEEEKGPDPRGAVWPGTNSAWAQMQDAAEIAHKNAAENVRRFLARNEHNWLGFAGGGLSCETATYALANLEGEEEVVYDYTATTKVGNNLLEAGYYPDPSQPRKKLDAFEQFLGDVETFGLPTSKVAILAFCKENEIQLLEIAGTS